MPEIWDLYDEHHNLLGKTHTRGKPITQKGEYHLVVDIITTNSRGELLITQRHPNKPTFPLKWEFTGGAVVAGEDSLNGALRELNEETGITANKNELEFLGTILGGTALHDVYHLKKDIPLSKLRLQETEVVDAKWVTDDIIKQMIQHGIFLPWVYERYSQLKGETI